MERRLAGVLAICIVLSTIITLFIVGEKARGVTLVENRYPDSIFRSREEGTFAFHHGMVCRQDYAVLEINFYALRKVEMNLTLQLHLEKATISRLSERIPKISALDRMSQRLGAEPFTLTLEVEVDGEPATLRLFDFTIVFDAFAPEKIRQFPEGARSLITSPDAILSFAFLFDKSNKCIAYYEGIRDFFPKRELVLADLYIRRNDQTDSFTSSRMASQPKGGRILDAPKRGRLIFEDVKRDDRFEVGFSINSAWVSGSMKVIQLVRILGDNKEILTQANLIG